MAYTSVSTALNQKLSEKVKAKEPTKPLPKIASALLLESLDFFDANFLVRLVIVQNIKRTAKALETIETAFTIKATLLVSPKANIEKKAPIICKRGAPGG